MITIVGTAHISQDSVDEVRNTIHELKPDLVAVELCGSRYEGLTKKKDIPLFDLIKRGNFKMLMANTLLSFLQRRLGEEVGVKPGEEMLTAIATAKDVGSEYALIDRDIKITLTRAMHKMGFFEKLRVIKEMIVTFTLSGDGLEGEIDRLKKDENLSDILQSFKSISPNLYGTMVNERDAFMAHQLLQLNQMHENIVAVVGAGHKRGIEHYLENPGEIPDMDTLLETPKKRIDIAKLIKYTIPAFILGTFALAFHSGVPLNRPLGLWVLFNAIPTFFGVLLVGGHIISAIVGMVASPLTSLNPFLAAGWFAGAAEIKVRKVTVGDVSEMFKVTGARELYGNRAFKVLLVVAFANIGSSMGTFISIPKVILPLIKSIFRLG
ncbi:MAG: TraB/GumN family protein [Candidatus Hydrothermarchaeales archaeon]